MWDEFRALRTIPILVIRGENSDLLSAETVARMGEEHPHVESVTVAGEGHAPLLRYGATARADLRFRHRRRKEAARRPMRSSRATRRSFDLDAVAEPSQRSREQPAKPFRPSPRYRPPGSADRRVAARPVL